VSGARSAVLGAILAVAVAVSEQGLVRLVDASGAKDQPATVIVLLLAAFLGVLTAVITRTLQLPGAAAPTALVLRVIVCAGIGLGGGAAGALLGNMLYEKFNHLWMLVLGWILVPPIFGAIPSAATHLFARSAALSVSEGLALVVATIAASITLGVPGER